MDHILAFFQNLIALIRSDQLPQLGYWTYVLIAVLVAIEGPIATLLGAAAASAGLMRPGLVFLAASTGNLSADCIWYTIGYLGKIEWILRFGKRLGIRSDFLGRLERGMHRHALRIILLAKLTLSFVIPTLVAAGLVKAPWKKWFPAVFMGEMIWTGSLVLIGYYTTEAIKRVEKGIEYAVLAGSVIFVIFMLWFGRRLLKAGYISRNGDTGELKPHD